MEKETKEIKPFRETPKILHFKVKVFSFLILCLSKQSHATDTNHVMQVESSSPCLQESFTGSYSEPYDFSLHEE
jgi:hypothetical protein